jgi:23S rRNA (cytidine2498-2'-O)-methyltransferase
MSTDAAQFVFMTCRAGAEAALKAEVARTEPTWRPAFSRPGFLTFKVPSDKPLDERQLTHPLWTLARTHGISLGRFSGTELSSLVDQLWRNDGLVTLVSREPFVDIHVWQRELHTADEDASDSVVTPLAVQIDQAVRDAAPDSCAKVKVNRVSNQTPIRKRPTERDGLVLDVVLVEPGEWWIGYHRAVTLVERWPGGVIPVRMPAHAVSRAYMKMEEALQWSGLPVTVGDECVEIGCAPGGASQALLDRGLFVTGIDPAEVDPTVLEHPRFRHLKKRGKEVRRQEFLGVRWLAADMNIAPAGTLETIEAIVTHPGISIRGLVLTLKFADWGDVEQVPEFVERVRGWGFRDVRVRQLATGGTEVCLAALRRKALRRLGRGSSPGRKRRRDTAHTRPPKPHF